MRWKLRKVEGGYLALKQSEWIRVDLDFFDTDHTSHTPPPIPRRRSRILFVR